MYNNFKDLKSHVLKEYCIESYKRNKILPTKKERFKIYNLITDHKECYNEWLLHPKRFKEPIRVEEYIDKTIGIDCHVCNTTIY